MSFAGSLHSKKSLAVYFLLLALFVGTTLYLGYSAIVFLLFVTTLTHAIQGLWREAKYDKIALISFAGVWVFFDFVRVNLRPLDFIYGTSLVGCLHYLLDIHFLFDERVSLRTISLGLGLVIFSFFPFWSLDSLSQTLYLTTACALSLYGISVSAYEYARHRITTLATLELSFILTLFVALTLSGQIVHLRYFYAILGSIHSLNWFYSVHRYILSTRSPNQREKMTVLKTYWKEASLGLSTLTVLLFIFLNFSEKDSPLKFLFAPEYHCVWISTHILTTFRLDRLFTIATNRKTFI